MTDITKLVLQNDSLKSEMTFQEFVMYIAEADLTTEKKLKLYSKVGDLFIQSLYLMFNDKHDKHKLIHMTAHPLNFTLGKSKFSKKFHPLQPKSIQFEPIPICEVSLFADASKKYNNVMFDTWDGDYIYKSMGKDQMTLKTNGHCSLEMYLMTYMSMYMDLPKSYDYFLEEITNDKLFMDHLQKIDHILYFALPKMVKIIKKNKHYQKRYLAFEKKLRACVRILYKKSGEEQYNTLKSMKKLRHFLDVLKTRSHLPTAYGMYIMQIMHAMNYEVDEKKKYIQNTTKAPGALQSIMGYYWMQMLLPFDESK